MTLTTWQLDILRKMDVLDDAAILDGAADILLSRSHKRTGILLGAFIKVLHNQAAAIRREQRTP